MSETLIDISLYITYALFLVAAAAAVLFPLFYLVKHPKEAKGALAGLGALVVIFVLAYVLSGDEVRTVYAKFGVDAAQSKLIGSTLIALYMLGIGAVAAAVYAEVSRFFK